MRMYAYMYIFAHMHVHTYIYIYIYRYTLVCKHAAWIGLAEHYSGKSQDRGRVFFIVNFFCNKTIRGSPSADGSQRAGSNTAIESFWRWKLFEI